MRGVILIFTLIFGVRSISSAQMASSSLTVFNIAKLTEAQPLRSPAQHCCKVCRKGKACGDSCIANYKTCHVGPGCACDSR